MPIDWGLVLVLAIIFAMCWALNHIIKRLEANERINRENAEKE